jgi:hypothetical protein
MIKTLITFIALAFSAAAQTTTPTVTTPVATTPAPVVTTPAPVATTPAVPVPVIAYQPSYFLAAGADYDYIGKTPSALTVLGVKIANNTYSLTNLNLFAPAGTGTSAAIQTGILRLILQEGNWTLGALTQAGVVTSTTGTVGQVNGGGMIAYDIGAKLKSDHFYIAGFATIQAVNGVQVKPVFGVSFGKTF